MSDLNRNRMVIFPPVRLNNQNLQAAFQMCQGEMTQKRAEDFIADQSGHTYQSFADFAPPFVGQLWSLSEEPDDAAKIATFIDKSNRICLSLLDNDPSIPLDQRGANLLLISTGYGGKEMSVAILSKNNGLVRAFASIFPGKPMVDDRIFSEPNYSSYPQHVNAMRHLSTGHTVGKTCPSCHASHLAIH
jgi:hypothetical protein